MFPETLAEDSTNAQMLKSQEPFDIHINNNEYNEDSIIKGKQGFYYNLYLICWASETLE